MQDLGRTGRAGRRSGTAWAGTLLVAGALVTTGHRPEARGQEEDLLGGDLGPRTARFGPSVPTMSIALPGARLHAAQLVALPDGRAFVAAIAWTVAANDQLVGGFITPGAPVDLQPITPPAADVAQARQIVQPCALLESDGKVRLVWTEVVDGAGRLATARQGDAGFGAVSWLATGTGPVQAPAAVVRADGTTWLAWQRFVAGDAKAAGVIRIEAAPLVDGRLGTAQTVGGGGNANRRPAFATTPDGTLWIAWQHSDGSNYEIALAHLAPGDLAFSAPMNVSRQLDADDLHPALAGAPDGTLWIAWDRSTDPRRGISWKHEEGEDDEGGGTPTVEICLAALRGETVEVVGTAPGEVVPDSPAFGGSGGLPTLSVDPTGGVHLFLRWFEAFPDELARHAYPVAWRSVTGDGFGPHRRLDGSDGAFEPAALAATSAGVHVVVARDERSRLVPILPERKLAASLTKELEQRGAWLNAELGPWTLSAAFVPWPKVSSPPPRRVLERPPAAPPATIARVPAPPRARATRPLGDESVRVWYGELHRHSNFSRCMRGSEAAPEDRYAYARDLLRDDFFALTDHPGHLDPLQWWEGCKRVDLERTADFAPLQGFEWSSSATGHQNVILRKRTDFVASGASPRGPKNPPALFELLKQGEALAIPHHPAHARVPFDWDVLDPDFNPVIEIYQAARGNFEFFGAQRSARQALAFGCFAQDALDRGRELGFIAATDHGNGAAYAGVLAPRGDAASIFDAIAARQVFATTVPDAWIDLRVNGVAMGGRAGVAAPPKVEAVVHGTGELAEVVVFRGGAVAYAAGRPASPPLPADTHLLELRTWAARESEGGWELVLRCPDGKVVNEAGPGMPRAERRLWAWTSLDPTTARWEEKDGRLHRGETRRFRVVAGLESSLDVKILGHRFDVPLAALHEGSQVLKTSNGTYAVSEVGVDVDPIDLARGLGSADHTATFEDAAWPQAATWYYARATQMDGEMLWSSPVIVTRE